MRYGVAVPSVVVSVAWDGSVVSGSVVGGAVLLVVVVLLTGGVFGALSQGGFEDKCRQEAADQDQ